MLNIGVLKWKNDETWVPLFKIFYIWTLPNMGVMKRELILVT